MAELIPPSLAELAVAQDCVVSRAQLRAAGVRWAHEQAQVAARRWVHHPPSAVVLHNGPVTRRQSCWVALLNAGAGAAVCAATALELDGLTGWHREPIHLLVVKSTVLATRAGVKIHESRRFDPVSDIHPTARPVRTRAARSALDAATWSKDPRTAVGWLAATVQQGLARPADIAAELERAGRIRYHVLLARAIGDIEGGATALSEIDFARLCRRHGLPEPVRQAVRVERSGRRRYLDAEWERADGRRVAAEVDGAVHLLPRTYWDDMDRSNELVLDGRSVLRFPAFVIRAHPDRVVEQLRRALTG